MKTFADLAKEKKPIKKKKAATNEVADLVNQIAERFQEPFKTWHWVVRRSVKVIGVQGAYMLFKGSKTPQSLMFKLKESYGKKYRI